MDKPRLNLRLLPGLQSPTRRARGGRKKKVKQTVQRVGRVTSNCYNVLVTGEKLKWPLKLTEPRVMEGGL